MTNLYHICLQSFTGELIQKFSIQNILTHTNYFPSHKKLHESSESL
jgi:hypothetical protein